MISFVSFRDRRVWVCLMVGALDIFQGNAVPTTATDDNKEIAVLKQTSKAFASIAKKAIPAVVSIKVEKIFNAPAGMMPFFFETPDQPDDDILKYFFYGRGDRNAGADQFRQMAQGTGFLISKDGYILTNNHIVGDADKIVVRLHDGREFQAERIGSDPGSEVAVIKIKGENFPFVTLGDSEALDIGEWVIAIGNAFGLSETLTVGVVSAKGRNNIGITDYGDFIQTDAAINPGNSGGPLLNVDGEVIGINTAIFSQTGGSIGIGFAIPISMALRIKDQLIKTGKVTRGYLGIAIQDLTPDLAESFGHPQAKGVLVAEVVKGSVADKNGLKSGDIITEVDGKKIENASAFRNQVAMTPPGTEMKLTLLREGKPSAMKITIGSQSDMTSTSTTVPAVRDTLGITVENLSDKWIRRFGYEPDSGVIVTRVLPGSPAYQADIQPGNLICSINHQPVRNVEEFNSVLSKAVKSKLVLLLVKDTVSSRYIPIRLEEAK